MNLLRVRRLFAGERVARFGTVGPGDHPHQIPVRFAVIPDGGDGVIACMVDSAAPTLAAASRFRHLSDSPKVSFLVDGDDGWWAEAAAVAEVLRRTSRDPRYELAAQALAHRYPEVPTPGALIWATVTSWAGWDQAATMAA